MNTPSERARWRKSSHSATGNDTCVELADLASAVGVRDSVDPDGPKLAFSRGELAALVGRIKAGEVDL
jgi:hypothetical protein